MEACKDYTRINEDSYEIMKSLFDYCSPITLEGAIVSIADEIAQFSHDIEDMRRLSSFNEMLNYYNMVKDTLLNDLSEQNMKDFDLIDTYCTFSTILEEVKNHNSLVMKLERTYTKLILSLSIPLIGKLINHLWRLAVKVSLFSSFGRFKYPIYRYKFYSIFHELTQNNCYIFPVFSPCFFLSLSL